MLKRQALGMYCLVTVFYIIPKKICRSVTSELKRFGGGSEGRKNCGRVFEIQYLSIVIFSAVHRSQIGVLVKHGAFNFVSVIVDKLTADTQPCAV